LSKLAFFFGDTSIYRTRDLSTLITNAMEVRILEEIYPDDYNNRNNRLKDREVESISSLNCLKVAQNANEEYAFFLRHPRKPAFYLVDWRVIYSALDEFLNSADLHGFTYADRSVLQRFQSNYEGSSVELYHRLGKSDNRTY
jgi:hypothetical protein